MNPTKVYGGIDLGGTTINMGLLTRDGEVVAEKRCASKVENGVDRVLDQIVLRIRDLIAPADGQFSLQAMGIGTAGNVNMEKGILIEATNFPDWHNIPIGLELEKRLHIPIVVDNDANVAAIGEHAYGVGRGVREMLMVTLGTGVGGGLILRGEIYRGSHGVAGEFGHTVIQQDGPLCGCGRNGCVEAFIGTRGIIQNVRTKLESGRKSLLNKIESGKMTPKDISEAARKGDLVAIEVFRDVGSYLGIALGNVANLLNIERVVVGGGVARAGEFILKPAREYLSRTALNIQGETIQIHLSTLGERAGMVGAARLAMLEGDSK